MSDWDALKKECPNLYPLNMIFECRAGWYSIIRDLSLKIERILEKEAEESKIPEGEENEYIKMFCVQVKEKYGTLRFYMTCTTDEISKLIEEVEELSSRTCEACGAPGKIRGWHWIEVKCDNCLNKENKND